MAEAPPPPLQTPAQPYSPGCSWCASDTTMRQPDEPIGWPSDTPPPSTLTFDGSRFSSLLLAMATAEKASLISKRAMSLISRPARLSAAGMAYAGAIGKSMGAHAASAKAARGM